MKNFLSEEKRQQLISMHRQEKNRRIADRIKAILLSDKGWTHKEISEALLLDETTISRHIHEYIKDEKLTLDSGGSQSKLDLKQEKEIIEHLEKNTYTKTKDICSYVLKKYGIKYTIAGMCAWLHVHGFSYKKPKPTPAKADPLKQERFINHYIDLKAQTSDDEPILFGDSTHPTMATKITHGWIRTGTEKTISTTASRTRVNIVGALELETMHLITSEYKTVNSENMILFLDLIKQAYPKAPRIHLILDQGPYNKSIATRNAAKKRNITIHYLPPYSPNLNPIERLWKVMNEFVRNNYFFSTAKEFRQKIISFFDLTWPKVSWAMSNRINDNFQRINQAV